MIACNAAITDEAPINHEECRLSFVVLLLDIFGGLDFQFSEEKKNNE